MLSGLEDLYLSNTLMDTTPEFQSQNVDFKNRKVSVSIETIIMTAVVFITVITWFEVLRSLFDNIFSETDKQNYKAIGIRVLYAVIVTIIAVIIVKIFGKDIFKDSTSKNRKP